MKIYNLLLIFLISCLLSACSSTTVYYSVPQEMDSRNAASIVGTRLKTGILLEDQRFYTINIDGFAVKNSQDNSEKPISVQPGTRKLTTHFRQGSNSATVDFDINLEPGQKVQIVGRIVSYQDGMITSHVPDQVGIKIVDVGTQESLTKEVIRPVLMSTIVVNPVLVK